MQNDEKNEKMTQRGGLMKKKIVTLIAIAAILSICGLVFIGCAPSPQLEQGDFSIVSDRHLPAIRAGEDNEIQILQLTDTHLLGNTKKDEATLQGIEKTVKGGNYDLVVITGDMVEGYNKSLSFDKPYAIERIATLFESLGQYWAFVAGNNDGEYCGDNRAVFAALAKYEHCLVSDAGVGGVGNYTIDIEDAQGRLAHTLFFIDSRMRNDQGKLLAIDRTQIDWYREKAISLRDRSIMTTMFMHIPFREFADAYTQGEKIGTYADHAATLEINVHEDSSRLLDAILEVGNNGLIGTGHTHGSDYLRYYRDMYWLQVRACGENAWNDKLPRGGARIVIDLNAVDKKETYRISDVDFT